MLVGQTARNGVGRSDGTAGEGQMRAQFAGGGGHQAGAPDVRYETDRGLGHGDA